MAYGLLVRQHYHVGRQRWVIARSGHQSGIQIHGGAHSHRESIRRDHESENGIRSTHLKN
jgi:hypothetical protein